MNASASAVRTEKREPALSLRRRRMFRDLALVLVFCWLFYELRQITAAITRPPDAPPAPLEFRVVAERYNEIHYGMAPWQVEQLLGPPTERHASGPEINRAEESWWNGGRNYFPENRIWHRWSDSNDPDRWVAVAYTGFHTKRMVHLKIMRDL